MENKAFFYEIDQRSKRLDSGDARQARRLDLLLRDLDTSSNLDDMISPYEDDLDA
jgi:hypothetical protein